MPCTWKAMLGGRASMNSSPECACQTCWGKMCFCPRSTWNMPKSFALFRLICIQRLLLSIWGNYWRGTLVRIWSWPSSIGFVCSAGTKRARRVFPWRAWCMSRVNIGSGRACSSRISLGQQGGCKRKPICPVRN